MSQTIQSSGSEKSSRQGILRIFRQSVRELGHRAKADATTHGKENVKLDHEKLTENQTSFKKSLETNGNTDVKSYSKESFKKNDKKTLNANKKVELCTRRKCKFRPTPSSSQKTSPQKERYPKLRDKKICGYSLNKDKGDDTENTADDFADDENSDIADGVASNEKIHATNHEASESWNSEYELKKVTEDVHKNDNTLLEDWDKELEKNIESRNSPGNVHVDLADNVYELGHLEEHVLDNKECASIDDKEDASIDAKLLDENDNSHKRADLNSGENSQRLLKSDKKTEEERLECSLKKIGACSIKNFAGVRSADEVTETDKRVLDFVYLDDKQKFEIFSVGEEIRLEEHNLPLHSTPKKIKSEPFSNFEVNKEFCLDDGDTYLCSDDKQGNKELNKNLKAETESYTSGVDSEVNEGYTSSMERKRNPTKASCSRDDGYRQTKSHNLPAGNKRTSRDFDTPPRFKKCSNEKGKTEQKEKDEGTCTSDCDRFPGFQQRNQNNGYPRSEAGFGHRRYRKAGSYDISQNFQKYSSEFRGFGCHNHRTGFQQRGCQVDSGKMSQLDWNPKSSDKQKNSYQGRGSGKLDSDHRNNGRSPWKIPVSEDWTSEMFDIGDIEDESNVNDNVYFCHDLTADYDLTQNEINKITVDNIPENDLQEGINKMKIVEQMDNDESEKFQSQKDFSSDMEFAVESKHEFSFLSQTPQLPDDKIESGSFVDNESETKLIKAESGESNEKHTLLLKQETLYLPPMPVEVIECGENNVMSECNTGMNERDRNSVLFASNSVEANEENMYDCLRSNIITVENNEISDQNKLLKNEKNEMKEDSVVCANEQGVIDLGEDARVDIVENITNIDVENNTDTVLTGCVEQNHLDIVQEESCSVTSNYARRRHSNMISETDVLDMPLDVSKVMQNDMDSSSGSEYFCYAKSVEETDIDTRTHVEQTEFDMERYSYDMYARYCYEQDVMNGGEQFGTWHPNYPYNYEAYCRWLEYKQYEMNYYWDMYYRQAEYADQLSGCYDCCGTQTYSSQDKIEAMETYSDRDSNCDNEMDVRFAEAKHKMESKSNEKGRDKKSPVQNTGNMQQRNTFPSDFEGTHLSEYQNERTCQWLRNQKPEDKNGNDLSEILPDCRSEKSTMNQDKKGKYMTKFNISVDTKVKPAQSAPVKRCTVSANDKKSHSPTVKSDKFSHTLKDLHREKVDPEVRDASDRDKLDIPCSCKPSQRLYMVWRLCDCPAGNPAKLQKILSHFDDRSQDLGYQSYESLEHDESVEGKKLGQKAPGFVIQPLWSTPASHNSNTEHTCNSEKGIPAESERVGDKSGTSRDIDKPQAPPGFEQVVDKTRRQKVETGMKKNQDRRTVSSQEINSKYVQLHLNSQSENDTQHKMTSPAAPSLKHLIEQQNLQHGPQYSCHPSRVKAAEFNDGIKQHSIAGNSASPFSERDYSKLPMCVSDGVEHLKKAHVAIATAEMSQEVLMNSLKSAVNIKINELQQSMFEKYGNVDDAEKGARKDGSVEQVEVGTKNCRLKTAMTGKQTPLKVGQPFGGTPEEIHHEKDDLDVRKVIAKKDCGRKPYNASQHKYGSLGSVLKSKVEDSRDIHLRDNSLWLGNSNVSSKDDSGTSGDDNINFSIFTQSPQASDDEPVTIRPSKMVESRSDKTEILRKNIGTLNKRFSNETGYDIEEGEILEHEVMQGESRQVGETVKSGRYSRADIDGTNRPRMCYRPRSPCPSFPPPYRGGSHRPLMSPVSHMEHWPMDPRYTLPPPPLRHWPPPTMHQMYGPHLPYRPRSCYENVPQLFHEFPKVNKLEDEKAQVRPRCPQPFQYYHSASRDGCTEQIKNDHSGEIERCTSARKQRSTVKLVDYGLDTGDESSTDIEPFDIDILGKTEEEIKAKSSSQLKPTTPKKLKFDTDEDTSSKESSDMETSLHASTRNVVKLSRGPPKKLKQKSLKHLSASERHVKDDTKKMHKDQARSKSLSEIIAETKTVRSHSSEKFDSKCVDAVAQEFPALGSKQETQLSPLPPLPPFPNSPFWSMYTPGKSSALTGKTEENQYRRGNPDKVQQRKWEPASPFRRYSYSPARASSLYSTSETDSEAATILSDWKTNFKLFHSFGVKYIDTHCHIDFIFNREGFKGSFKAYMDKHSETFPETFEGCVAVFCNPSTFTPAGGLWLDVAKEPNVWIAMGCHPKMAQDFTAAAELGLKKCLRHTKCIALGEIGLDYSGTFYQHTEVQKQVFRRQLKMAVEMAKVLVIHCRDAEADCLEIMKEMVPPKWKIHCHCFTNGYESAKLWIDAFPNLFIGVTPLVTYRTAKPTHDLARKLPITKLLLETDAPYFIPRCIPREDLPLSNPGLAVTVAKEIAQYQELPVAAVLRQCRLNTNFMYGI